MSSAVQPNHLSIAAGVTLNCRARDGMRRADFMELSEDAQLLFT
jgi:hypothetical protein